jgi:hypothetical protein
MITKLLLLSKPSNQNEILAQRCRSSSEEDDEAIVILQPPHVCVRVTAVSPWAGGCREEPYM